mmetsp:Transcript_33264/g.83605  ORF Transcript_33264/g.83605 Transcript_33264/m.83605 type:complete len:222 (+) Transcript_33264:620-1285(+)
MKEGDTRSQAGISRDRHAMFRVVTTAEQPSKLFMSCSCCARPIRNSSPFASRRLFSSEDRPGEAAAAPRSVKAFALSIRGMPGLPTVAPAWRESSRCASRKDSWLWNRARACRLGALMRACSACHAKSTNSSGWTREKKHHCTAVMVCANSGPSAKPDERKFFSTMFSGMDTPVHAVGTLAAFLACFLRRSSLSLRLLLLPAVGGRIFCEKLINARKMPLS